MPKKFVNIYLFLGKNNYITIKAKEIMIEAKDIEKLSMNDLVAYYNANKALKDYYANTAQMNECYRNTNEKNLFEEPLHKQMKCTNVEAKIMDEFEKRLINEE